MAKTMTWMKTNMKLAMDNTDATIADLITDGCGMIKTVSRYINSIVRQILRLWILQKFEGY